MKFLKMFLLVISSLAGLISCKKNSENTGGTTVNCNDVPNKTFSAHVNPIIQSRCAIAGCHAAGSPNIPLTNYAQVYSARTAIRSAVISGSMPKNGTLSAAEKNSIICWIDSGAPNN
ncbi:MAG: hypothetical protein N2747_05960 [Chitinophagaceae bacterium]|nr:hypothetical protein [Chitinophagaceae bacterium]